MESTQPSQQAPVTPRPRLERLRGDRAIAGVASGLARYLGIDVAWVRIAFVVAAIFGGTGILAYLIGWLAIPEEGETESIAVDKAGDFPRAGSWVGIGLIVLAGMIVLGNTGLIEGELLFAAALVAIGVLLYRGDIGGSERSQPTSTEAAPVIDSAVAETVTTPVAAAPVVEEADSVVSDEPPMPSYAIPPAPPVAPRPPDPAFQPRPAKPRESSVLGRFALATLLIVVGTMGVGQSAGWFEPSLRHYAAAILVVLGASLLLSTWFGRARGLIVLGLALSPLLVGMALLKVPFEGGFGDPRHAPDAVVEVESEYRLIAGQMVLDLSDLEVAEGEVVELEASVVFGRLEVIAPAGVNVEIAAKVDAGEMFIDGLRSSQLAPFSSDNVNLERVIAYEGVGQITIETHVGFGELNVSREAVPQDTEVTP